MAMSQLRDRYKNEIVPALKETFAYSNVMEVPKVEKIVINMSVGDDVQDSKALDAAMRDLALITGQKPAVTRAKKSIANLKLRDGMPIGWRVTLRGGRMYDFL